MCQEILGKIDKSLVPFPSAPLSSHDLTTEFTDQYFFSEYSETSVGIYRGFSEKSAFTQCKEFLKFELVDDQQVYLILKKQLNQLIYSFFIHHSYLIYSGIHFSFPNSSTGSSQNQSGNLIKMKIVVEKYTYKVNLTYCKKFGRLQWFLYNPSTDLEKPQRNSCILIYNLPCLHKKPQIFRLYKSRCENLNITLEKIIYVSY